VRFLLIGIVFLLGAACLSEPDCLVTASNEIRLAFKNPAGDSIKFVKFISITTSGSDSIIYRKDSASVMTLRVNPNDLNTTFTFQYKEKTKILTNSVTVSYVRQNVVVGPTTCGAFAYFNGLAVVATTFTTPPRITNAQLSNSATVSNLEIRL